MHGQQNIRTFQVCMIPTNSDSFPIERKGKIDPLHYKRAYRRNISTYSSPLNQTESNVQRHIPASLPQRKDTRTHWTEGRLDPTVSL